MEIVCRLLQVYIYLIFARVILSWVSSRGDGPLGSIASVIDKVTDPVMMPLRQVLPPVRMGGMALDLSPIVVLFGINILQSQIC